MEVDAELALKLIAACGGLGGTLTGIVYSVGRYFRDVNSRLIEKIETNAKERLAEKDAIIAELKADNAIAKQLILQQNESLLRQTDQQQRLIDVLQAAGKATS